MIFNSALISNILVMPNVLLKNHSDELYFLWNPFWSEDYPLNPEDSLMSSTLVQMWTNFARHGKDTMREI